MLCYQIIIPLHLPLSALCITALQQLRTVKYIRANVLLQQSEKARKTNSSYEYTNGMSAYKLLVIDDFGLMELDMDKCRDLFEIIETRDSRKAIHEGKTHNQYLKQAYLSCRSCFTKKHIDEIHFCG